LDEVERASNNIERPQTSYFLVYGPLLLCHGMSFNESRWIKRMCFSLAMALKLTTTVPLLSYAFAENL
jgi:hypothetical protein